jgi:hypothetical protein
LKWKNSFRNIGKRSWRRGKTYMKQSFCRRNWNDWDWISRKIILKSPIWLQEKLVDNFKGLETMI